MDEADERDKKIKWHEVVRSPRALELLRAAGCKCKYPLYGWRPGIGPRCRLCNTVAQWDYEDTSDNCTCRK